MLFERRQTSGRADGLSRRGQTMVEFIILLAALAVLALIVAGLLGMLPKNSLNVKIGESQAYWSSQAGPIKITDWSMRTVNTTVPQLAVASNLSMVLFNPTTQVIVVHAITLSPGNFSQVYYSNGQWAGPADTLSITLHPGEQKTIIVEHWASGPAAYLPPDIYQLAMSIKYTQAFTSSIEAGAVPLVGGNQYVIGEPGSACPTGTVQCNGSGVCAPSSSCCGQTACTAGQFCCASACCQSGSELCINGTCTPASSCIAPDFACGGVCCNGTLYGICNSSGQCQECTAPNTACGSFCCPAGGKCFNDTALTYGQACLAGGLPCSSPTSVACGNYCCLDGTTCTNPNASNRSAACQAVCGGAMNVTCGGFCCPADGTCVNPGAPTQALACSVPCGSPNYNSSNTTCNPATCPPGLTCDSASCSCVLPMIACGAGGFNASLNSCSPTNTCLSGQYCQISDCTCQPQTPVACGSGPFNSTTNLCSPNDTCPTDQFCQVSDCTCQPKTAVACGGGITDPSTQYCSPAACVGGLNCDNSTCLCTNKTAVACGSGAFDSNLNFCSPTDNCPSNQTCRRGDCTCQPKTAVACGSGGTFNASASTCSPTSTCTASQICTNATCTCACPSGKMSCNLASGLPNCCTSGNCLQSQQYGQGVQVCCGSSTDTVCKTDACCAHACSNKVSGVGNSQSGYDCCSSADQEVCDNGNCCTAGGCRSADGGGATICCPVGNVCGDGSCCSHSCQSYAQGYQSLCCPNGAPIDQICTYGGCCPGLLGTSGYSCTPLVDDATKTSCCATGMQADSYGECCANPAPVVLADGSTKYVCCPVGTQPAIDLSWTGHLTCCANPRIDPNTGKGYCCGLGGTTLCQGDVNNLLTWTCCSGICKTLDPTHQFCCDNANNLCADLANGGQQICCYPQPPLSCMPTEPNVYGGTACCDATTTTGVCRTPGFDNNPATCCSGACVTTTMSTAKVCCSAGDTGCSYYPGGTGVATTECCAGPNQCTQISGKAPTYTKCCPVGSGTACYTGGDQANPNNYACCPVGQTCTPGVGCSGGLGG